MTNKVFPTVHQLVDQVEQTQQENIEAAGAGGRSVHHRRRHYPGLGRRPFDGGRQWKSRIAQADSSQRRKL